MGGNRGGSNFNIPGLVPLEPEDDGPDPTPIPVPRSDDDDGVRPIPLPRDEAPDDDIKPIPVPMDDEPGDAVSPRADLADVEENPDELPIAVPWQDELGPDAGLTPLEDGEEPATDDVIDTADSPVSEASDLAPIAVEGDLGLVDENAFIDLSEPDAPILDLPQTPSDLDDQANLSDGSDEPEIPGLDALLEVEDEATLEAASSDAAEPEPEPQPEPVARASDNDEPTPPEILGLHCLIDIDVDDSPSLDNIPSDDPEPLPAFEALPEPEPEPEPEIEPEPVAESTQDITPQAEEIPGLHCLIDLEDDGPDSSSIDELAAQVVHANQRVVDDARERQQIEEQLGAALQRIEELEQEIESATYSHDAAPMIERASHGLPVTEVAHLRRRKTRLRRQRQLLQAETVKLTAATAAIKQRADDLAEREEECKRKAAALAEAGKGGSLPGRSSSSDGDKKAPKTGLVADVQRFSTSLITVSLALVVLAGLSWGAASQFATVSYSTTATIAAEARDRPLNDDERAEWQRYHEGLLEDPVLLEMASEHMARRGIVSLGSPGLLEERINADLVSSSMQPGELTLELRGDGAEQTRRTLDTLAATIVSRANATRQRRADGAVSAITQAPAIAGAPISDTRPLWAGGILLGLIAVTSLASVYIARRTAKAEQSIASDDMELPAHWLEKPKSAA